MTVDFDRVELSEVSRHFGRRRAVFGVTMSAAAGDIVGLLGPNGAGKSTLIAMLATLVTPSSGSIRYGGRLAADAGDELRRRIGLLAHDLHLYSDLTARQNLQFFAQLYGLDASSLVPRALASADLEDRADDVVSGFSRGMRQRLGLERALLAGPKLLLLDEPFTGLDDRSTTIVMQRLRELAANGTIVIVATHDLDLADGLITRAAVVKGGRLICDEPAATGLRSRYRALVGHA